MSIQNHIMSNTHYSNRFGEYGLPFKQGGFFSYLAGIRCRLHTNFERKLNQIASIIIQTFAYSFTLHEQNIKYFKGYALCISSKQRKEKEKEKTSKEH